jgi:hypothetical protein
MNQQDLDHQTAVCWINSELNLLRHTIGEQNASAAVRSVIVMAMLLHVISLEEKQAYEAQVEAMFKEYNAKLKEAA